MSEPNRSQRILNALNQLQQFLPARRSNDQVAVNVLTGASVTAVASDDKDSGMLFVKFPGGESIEVNGDLYLDLQVTQCARLTVDGSLDGDGSYAKQSASDSARIHQKHELD
jgi:hypothetical protein